MTRLFYLLLTFGLSRQFLNTLGIAALLVLALAPPQALFSDGFQFFYLSLAMIGLFVLPSDPHLRGLARGFRDVFTDRISLNLGPAWRRQRRIRFGLEERLYWMPPRGCDWLLTRVGALRGYLLGLILCGVLIQVLTLPLSLYYSKRWVWTQALANLVLVPVFMILIPGCLLLFLMFWLPWGLLLAWVLVLHTHIFIGLMSALEG
jgi:hypothetical protein